jgi:hypothetical protein
MGTIWAYIGPAGIGGGEEFGVWFDTKGVDSTEPIHEDGVTVPNASAKTVYAYTDAHGSWGLTRTSRNYTVKWYLDEKELINLTDYSVFSMVPGFTGSRHDRYSLTASNDSKKLKVEAAYNGKTVSAATVITVGQ